MFFGFPYSTLLLVGSHLPVKVLGLVPYVQLLSILCSERLYMTLVLSLGLDKEEHRVDPVRKSFSVLLHLLFYYYFLLLSF